MKKTFWQATLHASLESTLQTQRPVRACVTVLHRECRIPIDPSLTAPPSPQGNLLNNVINSLLGN
jgi:hypothetical protein